MSETASASNTPPRFGLREYGIYRLPNGVELIACPSREDIIPLLLLSDWANFGEKITSDAHSTAFQLYHVDVSGRILRLDQPTEWNAYDDLFYTGSDVSPRRSE